MHTAFNLTDTPLPPGKLLIEASAGTGKTYSLTGIILRLIIENDIPIEKILTVTFTEAATAELNNRVRQAIDSLIIALEKAVPPPDAFERYVWDNHHNHPDIILKRLKTALSDFDRASIFTIHGFCSRTLADNAFESGSLFNTELLTNEKDLLQEIVNDYWRKQRLTLTSEEHFQILKIIDFESMSNALAAFPNSSDQAIIDAPDEPLDIKAFAHQLHALAHQFKQAVVAEETELHQIFTDSNQLSGTKYKAPRKQGLIDLLLDVHNSDNPLDEILSFLEKEKSFEFLTQDKISSASKKSTSLDLERQAFAIATDLQDTISSAQESWKIQFLHWASQQLIQRKAERNVMTFDDMLVRTLDALGNSEILLTALREKYQVALIDEFQDTDCIQLAIFEKVFGESPQTHRLYCVGDPKQSIYKFRGADLDSYLSVEGYERCNLRINYRSDESIVKAVNHLFTSADNPFGDQIPFTPATVPEHKRQSAPRENPAFIFRNLGQSPVQSSIARAVAYEALQLLDQMEGSFSSVAVLVNSHNQASAIASALREHGIPCIRKIDQSIFTAQAAILLRIALAGILECGRIRKLKAALATPLFGRSHTQLQQLDSDDDILNTETEAIFNLQVKWREKGFMEMFQNLLSSENIRARLLSYPGGEESLNLYLHLAELLHDHERRNHASPEALLQFLLEEADSGKISDAAKIRRSTDADAVIISTIHSSKGLEYDAVILPFAWSKPSNEWEDESMRKLYVAVTRAKHRCIVYVAANNQTHSVGLGQLLNLPKNTPPGPLAEALAESSEGFIGFKNGPPPASTEKVNLPSPDLACEEPPGKIPSCRIVTSFSGLTKSKGNSAPAEELVESTSVTHADDQSSEEPENIAPPYVRSEDPLPRGPRMGVAVHAIFETIDFTTADDLDKIISKELGKEGYHVASIHDHLKQRFPQWLKTPLLSDGTLRLEDIQFDRRINEMEFHLPIKNIETEAIAKALEPEQWQDLQNKLAQTSSLSGHIKGYIDLAFEHEGKFYIIDWKTNHLGHQAEDYTKDAIRASMLDHLYPLQYLIYTVALDAYLEQRIQDYAYETHFGGVFYVYLRGFGNSPGHSVFHSKPTADTLHNLRKCLLQEDVR